MYVPCLSRNILPEVDLDLILLLLLGDLGDMILDGSVKDAMAEIHGNSIGESEIRLRNDFILSSGSSDSRKSSTILFFMF